nr:hypothetical protein [Tissierella sp.]
MNIKNTVSIGILFCICITLGLGAAIIYSDYIYNPNRNLSIIIVADSSSMYFHPEEDSVTSNSSSLPENMSRLIISWAEKHQATIFQKNGFLAGTGFVAYSDWFKNELSITEFKKGEFQGVYIPDDEGFIKSYEKDGILFPSSMALEVVGKYDNKANYGFLKNSDFFYPMEYMSTVDGTYFTDSSELNELVALFKKHGYTILNIMEAKTNSITKIIEKLMKESFMSRAVLFSMVGLVFCFSYIILLIYRDNLNRLWIHHIFGLPRYRILIISIRGAVLISIASLVTFYTILFNRMSYMETPDLYKIIKSTITLYALLFSIINLIGYLLVSKHFALKGG